MTALAETLKQRNSVYGDFTDNAEVSQELKRSLLILDTIDVLPNYIREALDLIATKLSRIVTGDPTYVDNWHDIAGYAKLVEERLTGAKALDQFEPAPDVDGGFVPLNPSYVVDNAHTAAAALTDEDAANIGRELMGRLPDGYCYADSPAEIVTELQNKVDELRAEVLERRNQLPIDMQDCTIKLVKCEKSHAQLTATNWIDSGCPWCKVAELEEKLRRSK